MFRLAFSTVACPEWTLDRVASSAAELGFDAVELRTFGAGSTHLACDPALTHSPKVRLMFAQAGVAIASVASSARFDDPVNPPVLGLIIGDYERSVREAKHDMDTAREIGAPVLRVFAFAAGHGQRRTAATKLIIDRLKLVADAARNSGVRIALENGGGYPKAADIREIIDSVGSPSLGACYALAPSAQAGEAPAAAITALGSALLLVRVKDLDDKGEPARLGEGVTPCRECISELSRRGWRGDVVYEWDKLWLPELESAERVLPDAARRLYGWAAEAAPAVRSVGRAAVGV